MAAAAIASFPTSLATAYLSGSRPLRRHVSISVIAPRGGISLNGSQSATCRQRFSNNITVKATGEEVSTEPPEIVKNLQNTWDKVEDKYAVATLVAVSIIALWSATGMISAIDRLPVLPGVLELVGIGYTAWFVYSNLIFKPDREALADKIKTTYSDIIGTS